jgi:hypothetical protein
MAIVSAARAEPVTSPDAPRPWAIDAALGVQLAPLADDDVLERIAVGGAHRSGRWHVGARLAFAIGPRRMWLDEETVETGAWLRASRRLEVLVAWRVGHAGLHFGYATVHAIDIEPVLELAFRVSRALEVRFDPVATHLYRSGVWQVTFGPEVAAAWLL